MRGPNAAEAPAAGRNVCLKHRLDAVSQHKIGGTDNAGTGACGTVSAACKHGGGAVEEFSFADRRELARTTAAVHRVFLDRHGRDDMVAGSKIFEKLGHQIADAADRIADMMMRVDNRQFRFERLFNRMIGPSLLVCH
ncbi:MAG: hypothetical protein WDN48_01775 [Pseudolabrys sp.]